MDEKYFLKFEIDYNLIDLNYIFPIKPSDFRISISVDSYDEKTVENTQICYVAEKCVVS